MSLENIINKYKKYVFDPSAKLKYRSKEWFKLTDKTDIAIVQYYEPTEVVLVIDNHHITSLLQIVCFIEKK